MLEEYNVDQLNPRANPYAKELKQQITIKIAPSVIEYSKICLPKQQSPIKR